MKNKNWKKIKNSIDFIALSKTSGNKSSPQIPEKKFQSKWPLLRHTLSAVHYLLRSLFKNLKLSSTCVFNAKPAEIKTRPKRNSQKSKWKKVENSLHFINLSKTCVKVSKLSQTTETTTTENIEKIGKSNEKERSPEVRRIAKSRWNLLKNIISIINFLLRNIFKHLKLTCL